MFDKTFFDEAFYCKGNKGAFRNLNGSTYRDIAEVIRHLYGQQHLHMLDVGCGMGFVVQNLRETGETVDGMDVSQWAVEHSVVPGTFQGDVRNLASLGKHWDLVMCDRVLEYLPESEIPRALQAVAASGTLVYAGIITTDHNAYKKQGEAYHRANGRRTFRPVVWWEQQFAAAGMAVDEQRMEIFRKIRPTWIGQGVWPLLTL